MQFQTLTQNGIKSLTSLAITLIALGILMLLFPLVLAIVIASLFFLIALFCMNFAWKIYRASRNIQQQQSHQHTHVDVINVDPT
jgi:ABC-type bacteriocin/lantibiotic exporter with double-glycine peptidase domain